jgi:hypothetical protein
MAKRCARVRLPHLFRRIGVHYGDAEADDHVGR